MSFLKPIINKSQKTVSHSGEQLGAKIVAFKTHQQSIVKQLQQSVVNNNLYRNSSASDLLGKSRFIDEKRIQKQRSVSFLKKNIQKRIEGDVEAKLKLKDDLYKNDCKKQQIQKKLFELQKRNQNRIRQIEQFQKDFVNKVQEQLHKNRVKQANLKVVYTRLGNENKKIQQAKVTQHQMDQEEWKNFMQQKIKLQSIMDNHLKRQNKIIAEKNPEYDKKQHQKKEIKEQNIKQPKKRIKADAKIVGKQYLNFAKQKGSTKNNKHAKKVQSNLLNINLKVINYDNDILQNLIGNRNEYQKALSYYQNQHQDNKIEYKNITINNVQNQQQKLQLSDEAKSITKEQNNVFQFQEDVQTAKYLKQIKKNIKMIEQEREIGMITFDQIEQ